MQGKHAAAESLHERLQAKRERALGPDHPDVAESLNNRASLLDKQVGAVRDFREGSWDALGMWN